MSDSTYTIFYSWQSDLPNSETRGLIGDSIDAAVKSLKGTATIHADRDTKGEFGSPDIVQTVFAKIDECDVFVADVSAVTTYHPIEKADEDESIDEEKPKRIKATPNANVMIELGYATQVVGWDNIICIMNDDYNHDGEIPFDIEHHRLTHFSLKNKSKADVRKELRDIIASTVMNVMENGKRVRPQFSNICVGSWNLEDRTVIKNLIPYNVRESGAAKTMLDTLLDTASILLENIQIAKVMSPKKLPKAEEDKSEENGIHQEKIITKDGIELTPVSNVSLIDFNKWSPVVIKEEERIEIKEDIKNYFNIEVGAEFFDFGGLKRKMSIVPGFGSEYDGTDDETNKYDNYVEFKATIRIIKMFEAYKKTFDGLILIPLAAKNESSVSDSDIHISIQIDDSTAEVVYPTAELICDDLKGIEGYVYKNGLVELTLAQNNTADIKRTTDDKLWNIEKQQYDMNAMFRGGINGQPIYSTEDYVRELSRYVASPDEGNPTVFSFHISSLHAKEAKWLPRMIILRPLKETVQMKYFVKSSSSDGNLEGTLELTV